MEERFSSGSNIYFSVYMWLTTGKIHDALVDLTDTELYISSDK